MAKRNDDQDRIFFIGNHLKQQKFSFFILFIHVNFGSFLNSVTPYMKMILPPLEKGGILSILVVISGHKSVR